MTVMSSAINEYIVIPGKTVIGLCGNCGGFVTRDTITDDDDLGECVSCHARERAPNNAWGLKKLDMDSRA